MTDVATFIRSSLRPPQLTSTTRPSAMSTRSSDRPLPPRHSALEAPAPESPQGRLTRKRAASINTDEANANPKIENLSLNTPNAKSVQPVEGGRDLICLCTPAPKVPRPRNAFILYRQHHQAQVVAQNPGLANPEISKIIGEQWRDQPEEVKESWKRLAEEEKARHQRQYPDYRYQPRRGGKGPQARPASASGEDPGRCQKCGGRYIATPRTPSTPFMNPTPTPSRTTMPPYMTPNPRVIETAHFRHPPAGDMSGVGDPRGRPGYPTHPPGLQDVDEGYEMMSPGDPKRRRVNHLPGYYGAGPPYNNQHGATHQPRPSFSQGPPPPSYDPRGPLPGPSMLARSNTGPLGPPSRPPAASYAQQSRNPGFDESLRLPPLQTQLPTSPTQGSDSSGGPSASAPTGLGIVVRDIRESQARSIEAMVMSIPYTNKLKVLGKISPPLGPPGPQSPAVEIRGPVLALEGSDAALVKAVSAVVEKSLASSGECTVRTWSTGTILADAGSDDMEMVDGQSSDKSKSRTTSMSSSSSSSSPFGKYLQTIMEWHGKSDEIIKHVTTKPAGEKPDSAADKAASTAQLPVALITDGFSLTLSDKFASSVPIADSYAPVDHWQWMATLWRGIVGPDLVIYIRGATEEEVARLGGVDFKTAGIMIVRINEAKGLDEKTERRLGFEVMEWVRGGSFKEGFGRD